PPPIPVGTATPEPEIERAGRSILGLTFVIIAALMAVLPTATWEQSMRWAGAPWTSESFRWSIVALIATIGVSFLRSRPIFVVIYGAAFGLALASVDYVIGGKASQFSETMFGPGGAMRCLAVASAIFGYLVYTHPRANAPSLRGILGFLIVIAATELVVGAQ